jgi:GNAT superfamily N-acetyltransferase
MIRPARHTDWPAISRLLDQLEYPGTAAFLSDKLGRMLDDPAETLLVWDAGSAPSVPSSSVLLGFLSLHIIPQIALPGDFARISYFAVDSTARSRGIGLQMEEYAARLAREKGCELIEVHCHTRRVRAHAFYARQGYKESPKYLIKRLK